MAMPILTVKQFQILWSLGPWLYLNPKSMQNNSPEPIITAIKAIILHTFGVQVILAVLDLQKDHQMVRPC